MVSTATEQRQTSDAVTGAQLADIESLYTTWVSTTTTVTVAADGSYSTPFTFSTAVKESIRFNYAGKASGPWLSAKSPAKVFSIT